MNTSPSTNARKIRARKIVAFSAAPLALLVAGSMVWQGSYAAFSATTRNSGSSWSTGQVTLTDDDSGRAAFTVNNLVPSQTGQKCIVVTSSSTVAGEVRTYVQNLAKSAQGLEDHLKMTVDIGTGGSFNDCTGFTATSTPIAAQPLTILSTANNSYATGGTSWKTAGTPGETKSYRATWTFDTTGMTQAQVDALQGAQTSVDLVWELQSNAPTP
ncbi:hypothetical protein IV498_17975 [Paenarthrobacter sp. Z7-10]|uniref:hypothetical protein n=1 Tax=Paenarthrobacter sp. Z7-10 TaxID=2787635 RepID=UPI0022A93E25|nr:hypothetical protein [Paenarthrobacter sp. Z7-10]MCZ2404996.1 hypothetical protein [Paenarthrobacter sp. Z7-10]